MGRSRKIIATLFLLAFGGVLVSGFDSPLLRPPIPGRIQPIPLAPAEPLFTFVGDPDEAVQLAYLDAQTLPLHIRPFVRYIWTPDAEKESLQSTSHALNVISRNVVIQRVPALFGGRLVRIDLRQYAPEHQDLAEWLVLWEQLSFDPFFALLVTKDNLRFTGKTLTDLPKRTRLVPKTTTITKSRLVQEKNAKGEPLRWGATGTTKDGQQVVKDQPVMISESYTESHTEQVVEVLPGFQGEDDVFRFNAPGIDPVIYTNLQLLLNTQAPVVEHRHFKSRILSTIKEDKVYKAVFGGLYYDFRGIKKAKDVKGKDTKATDFDLFLESLGVGNTQAGLTARQLFDKIKSDQRTIIVHSLVTAKPRMVWMFHTPAGRETISWIAITFDVKNANIDRRGRSYANLLDPVFDAMEVIAFGPNGMMLFALFNDKGELQDAVPDTIAIDTTIPAPYTRQLEPAIGCLRCHGMDGSDGWKDLPNDAQKAAKSGRLNIFGDLGDPNKLLFDQVVLNRLAGLYEGDFSINLSRAKQDTARATMLSCGPWKQARADQTDIYRVATNRHASERESYHYRLVDPQVALLELGWKVPRERAAEILRTVLVPDVRIQGPGFVPEDPTLSWLKEGIPMNRVDWALSYSVAAERARFTTAKIPRK